jgi:hypothetical protein
VLGVAAALTPTLALLTFAAAAPAVEHHPKGDFAPFANCPLSNPATDLCIFAQTESGEFVVGNKAVPITKTITLQGGAHETGPETQEFIGAEDGKTLSKSPQNVPGGLAGLVNCNEIRNVLERISCELVFENGATGVTATTELAAPPSAIAISLQNLVEGEGRALSLPVKVKLDNPFLGASCFIGSNAHPIVLELTTGTTSPPPPNKPIKGKKGHAEFKDEFNLVIVRENSLVDNSFAVPGAQGCGGLFSFLIDPIIDGKLGIPAAAGRNTAILNGTLQDANAPAVRASE